MECLSSTAGLFTYDPLDHHRSQVRLLRLQPCGDDACIPTEEGAVAASTQAADVGDLLISTATPSKYTCSLEHVYLDENPKFCALSYAVCSPTFVSVSHHGTKIVLLRHAFFSRQSKSRLTVSLLVGRRASE